MVWRVLTKFWARGLRFCPAQDKTEAPSREQEHENTPEGKTASVHPPRLLRQSALCPGQDSPCALRSPALRPLTQNGHPWFLLIHLDCCGKAFGCGLGRGFDCGFVPGLAPPRVPWCSFKPKFGCNNVGGPRFVPRGGLSPNIGTPEGGGSNTQVCAVALWPPEACARTEAAEDRSPAISISRLEI